MSEDTPVLDQSSTNSTEEGWVDVRVIDAENGSAEPSSGGDQSIAADTTVAETTAVSDAAPSDPSADPAPMSVDQSVDSGAVDSALPSSDQGSGSSDVSAEAPASSPLTEPSSAVADGTGGDAEMSEADRAMIQSILMADDSALAASLASEGGFASGSESVSGMDGGTGGGDSSGFGGDTVMKIVDDRTFALGATQQTYLDRGREELYDIFPHFEVPAVYSAMVPPDQAIPPFSESVRTVTMDVSGSMEDAVLIDSITLIRLKQLVWGEMAALKDVNRWFSQGFGWVPLDDMRFGLLQLHGGPCGVLAPVQAFVLRRLLFEDAKMKSADSSEPPIESGSVSSMSLTGEVAAEVVLRPRTDIHIENGSDVPIQPTNEQRTDALIWALVRVILNCATDRSRLVFVVSVDEQSKNWFWYRSCSNAEELSDIIRQSLPLLHSRVGVIAFLFSVIMCRTPDLILSEVDDMSQPLVLPEFGHCSQELVNLMISGKAVTNIFDGNKSLSGAAVKDTTDPDVFVLRGIAPNQEIGFLTSLEVLKYVRVGEHYKTPLAPIWVVGSTSHYSVMFSLTPSVGKISLMEKEMNDLRRLFDVYDPLGHGFVEWTKMEQLLKDINESEVIKDKRMVQSVKYVWELRRLLDPEMTGVVVWNNFYNGYLAKKKELLMKWECDKCTFMNALSKTLCDICGARKTEQCRLLEDPEEVAKQAEEAGEDVKVPREFVLYHFNGLRQTKKDRPILTKLNVLDEAEMVSATMCYSEEMTGLVRTKWPYALVEWTGPFQPPKIG